MFFIVIDPYEISRFFWFSGMGLTMNCRADYTPPCKHVVYVYEFGSLSNTSS